jgi:hypothetical protein
MKIIGNADRQETGRWLNNRAENSHQVLSEELAVDMISLAFIVELVVLFSGFPGVAVFVQPK